MPPMDAESREREGWRPRLFSDWGNTFVLGLTPSPDPAEARGILLVEQRIAESRRALP
jgi:hypothetical protein